MKLGSDVFLPLEIFCEIIKYADQETLEKLSAATFFNVGLHSAVRKEQWQETTVVVDNFFISHYTRFNDASSVILANAVRPTSFKGERLHAPPAAYIKHLKLESVFKWNCTISPEACFIGGSHAWELERLLAACCSLRTVDLGCIPFQTNIDTIFYQAGQSIKSLTLQIMTPCLWKSCIKWRGLAELASLRRLKLGDVWWDTPGLFQAIETLQNLEELTIVAIDMDYDPTSSDDGIIYALLALISAGSAEPEAQRRILPSRLRSLTLSDANRKRYIATGRRPRLPTSPGQIALPALEDLFLESEDVTLIHALLEWWYLPSLKRLTVPSCVPDPIFGLEDGNPSTVLLQEKILQPMIARCAKSLEQIVLLDAWQERNKGDRLLSANSNWKHGFFITDLVCGTRPHGREWSQRIGGDPRVLPANALGRFKTMSQHCYMYAQLIDCHELAASLVRLRIEQVHFQVDLIGDIFRQRCFPKLRILMLYPWGPSSPSGEDENQPSRLTDFAEGRIAKCLLSLDLFALKVLALGKYRFWISKSASTSSRKLQSHAKVELGRGIWYLEDAKKHDLLAEDMRATLNSRDRIFLSDLPDHPQQQDTFAVQSGHNPVPDKAGVVANALFQSRDSHQMCRHRNYMVLHRQSEWPEEGLQCSDASEISGEPLHLLHRIPTWTRDSWYSSHEARAGWRF
ncbi:hypothetical protein MMC10_003808 [Thelotrema lepadinum]|nr:hypothetical protein [Thelotrema lepadinum]